MERKYLSVINSEEKIDGMKGIEIIPLRPISNVEYKKFKEAVSIFNNILKYYFSKGTIEMNFKDYELALNEYIGVINNKDIKSSMLDPNFNFNRLFNNYIFSIKTFLDHAETDLKRRYGEESFSYNEFKKITSFKYDNIFAYRFIYNLRNYAQHCGMSIVDIKTKVSIYKPTEVIIELDREELLKDKKLKKKIGKELQNCPHRFNLTPLMNEMNNAIIDVAEKILINEIDKNMDKVDYLMSLINEAKEYGVDPVIVENINIDNMKLKMFRLPPMLMNVNEFINSI